MRTDRLVFAQATPPVIEPVSLVELKAHCRVDISDDDLLLSSLIAAARQHCEDLCRRQFINATWRLSLDVFPTDPRCIGGWPRPRPEGTDILLPRPRLSSVTSIVYIDGAGVSQTLSPSGYIVSGDEEPGRIALAPGSIWPETQADRINSVVVTYVAGYGPAAAAVPQALKQAILMLAAHWYENRETIIVGTITSEIAFAVKALCGPYTCTEVW